MRLLALLNDTVTCLQCLDDFEFVLGKDPLEDAASFLDRGRDHGQAGGGQHQIGRGARGVGRTADGDADIGLLQGPRVVDAVARHADDIPIMMIAYDNAPFANTPVRWDMGRVLTVASALGIYGVLQSFVLYWIARDYLGLPALVLQATIFLKLLVSGHMTIYLTRNKGWVWNGRGRVGNWW